MRWIFYIGLIVSLYSCGIRTFSYKFSMNESIKPHKLYYENDTLSISFDFYVNGILIAFTNKSKEPVKINWDELKMTVNKIEKKIEHMQIRDGEIVVYEPPSLISPKSICADFVVYADNVSLLVTGDGEEEMKVKDMYPREGKKSTRDSVLNLIGQRITLLFPIYIKDVSYSRTFNFLLKDVKSTNGAWQVVGVLPYFIEFPTF